MALQNKIIENLDGSMTSVSFQDNNEIKDIVKLNTQENTT